MQEMKAKLEAINNGPAVNNKELHSVAIDRDDLLHILDGVLDGVASGAHIEDVANCIHDAVKESQLFIEAIKQFELKTFDSVKAGIALLGQAIESLPNAMTQCKCSIDEVKRLIQMVKNFKSPISFAYHVGKDILVNGVQIFHEIEDAVTSYKAQNWH
jgi:hypothetical protein